MSFMQNSLQICPNPHQGCSPRPAEKQASLPPEIDKNCGEQQGKTDCRFHRNGRMFKSIFWISWFTRFFAPPRGFSTSPRTAHTWPPPPPIWGWFNIYFSHDPTYFKTKLKQILLKIFVVTLFLGNFFWDTFVGHFSGKLLTRMVWCSIWDWVSSPGGRPLESGGWKWRLPGFISEGRPALSFLKGSCPDFVSVNWSGHVTSSSLLKCLRFALWGYFICCLCLV